MHHKTRALVAVGAVVASAVALAGCSGASTPAASTPAAAAAVDLSGVCPATVVVQTDWNPEADHGQLYEMVGPGYTVNADKKSVSGPLYIGGQPTGINIEVRSGGPAIGYQTVTSQLYSDDTITLGYVSTDEAVQFSATQPTVAVFAENDKSPQMIMWDPATYPTVKTLPDLSAALKASGGVIRYFGGAAYMDYLTGSGVIDKSLVDGTYDGTPVKFAAAQGKDAQQGFATAEPYIYQNETPAWGKPVSYQLVADNGYPIYPEAISVKADKLASLTPCLQKLIPVFQQADVDYFNDPSAANALIVDLVNQYNNGWIYDENVADYAVQTMKDQKIAANGPDGYVGEMTEDRVQQIITIDTPIYTAGGNAPKAGLAPSDLYTNQFLDTSIKLGF